MVLQWLKYIVPIFAFTYYCTSFTYNLAFPISFFAFLHLQPLFNVHSVYGFASTYATFALSLLSSYIFFLLLNS